MSVESRKPFVISRVLDAPRDKVWRSWTEVERLKQWWGPKGFIVHTAKLDLRPGGSFLYGMKAPDGTDMWGKFRYQEVKPQERLVFINSFSDPQGGITRHPWSPDWPLEMNTTIAFEEEGRKTKVTVVWTPAEGSSEKERQVFEEGKPSMQQGWTGTFENCEAYLSK